MENKVLIGIPTREFGGRTDFYDYVNMLEKPPNIMQMSVHGQSPAKSRNLIIEQALVNNCTHILFLDDDVAFKPNLLMNLLEHDKDMVTGLYLMRNYPHQPLIFDQTGENGSCRYHYLNGDESRLIKIVAAGLGAVLINTRVFKGMEKPWVRLGEYDKDHWCDDIGFFNRAREAGFELYCDLDTRVGHIGSLVIWPHKVDGKWVSGYDTGGQGMISVPQINPLIYTKDGIVNALQIEGWMDEEELIWLANTAKTCTVIVEFGSHCGRSTRALADNCPGVVYAVDPWDGDYLDNNDKPLGVLGGSRWYDFNRNLKDLIDSSKVIPFKGFSSDFTIDRKANLVFIDADHRYESVLEDINLAKKLIAPNGIIAGHDYDHPDWPGVKKAVDEVFNPLLVKTHGLIWWVQYGKD